MCLALVAFAAHPNYPLVIAANRDESQQRPTQPAYWWDEGILAGRDLEAGGTWFGVHRSGRWALVTNFREVAPNLPNALSRGNLVTEMLLTEKDIGPQMDEAIAQGQRYRGFNLLAGDARTLAYGSNRHQGSSHLQPGVYALSNHLLDTPWTKLVRTKTSFSRFLEQDSLTADKLFGLMRDTAPADDDQLPQTGRPIEQERLLSSPFIISPSYGTRSTTIMLMDRAHSVTLIERSFNPEGNTAGEVSFTFSVGVNRAASAQAAG